jgi:hypothetical protein
MRHRVAEIGHAPPHNQAAKRPAGKRNGGAGEKSANEKLVGHGDLQTGRA